MTRQLTPEQFAKLPRYARRHIEELERRVDTAEATIPWTEPGMEWFTLFAQKHERVTLFTCDSSGTRPILALGENDRLFVGRAKP